jgi:hypothetical protein
MAIYKSTEPFAHMKYRYARKILKMSVASIPHRFGRNCEVPGVLTATKGRLKVMNK